MNLKCLSFSYYRGTHGVVVVYDVTSSESYTNVKRWLHEIEANCKNVQRVLVGNKVDEPERRMISEADARRFAEALRIHYFETSAKENFNVEQVTKIKLLDTCISYSNN